MELAPYKNLRPYRHIFFDLDHTLWDYEVNSREVLLELYTHYDLKILGGFTDKMFVRAFKDINDQLWDQYNHGKIDSNSLRDKRFMLILASLGASHLDRKLVKEMGNNYLAWCPGKKNVIPHAHEILRYLQGHYQLHIVTNGFEDMQYTKLNSSNLYRYFDCIITSEKAGSKKPHPGIFEFGLEQIGATTTECVMIGDNLEADIKGAQNANIDQIYFNPLQKTHQEEITYEISCLSQIKEIL